MPEIMPGLMPALGRRALLGGVAMLGVARAARAGETVTLPIGNGERPVVTYPAEAADDRPDRPPAAARNPVRRVQ